MTRGIYLSGAPRLSTRPTTESLGPRSHMLGVINAFRRSGVDLDEFIVGDSAPTAMHSPGSEARFSSSWPRVLAADVLRLAYRTVSRRRLARVARRGPYDFAYERYALFQELGSVVRRRTSAFWILEVNALLALEATSERRATTSRRLARTAERRTLRSADLIVAVTAALAEQIREVHGIDPDRIVVIENGVDGARPRTDTRTTSDAGTRVGFLGTLYKWQSVDRLIRVLDDPRIPPEVTVHIAGAGPELEQLEAQVHERRMEGRVEFLGRLHPDAVPGFLADVDLCYAGHVSENGAYFSPLKLWEYLAAAKPVIATRHEATDRLEASGYAVRCFDGSDDDLAAVLHESLAAKGQLSSVAEERREAVLREHSWESRIRPLFDIIERKANQ